MVTTHYDPFYDPEDGGGETLCGIVPSEDADFTDNKDIVTCKRCIRSFPNIQKFLNDAMEARNKQDEGFVDFVFEQRYNCSCGFKSCMEQLSYSTHPETYIGRWHCPDCNEIIETAL